MEGYGNHIGAVVYSVNGTRIVSLGQLVAVLRDLKSEYVTIDFDGRAIESLVFPRAALTAATQEVLTDNDIGARAHPTCSRSGREARERQAAIDSLLPRIQMHKEPSRSTLITSNATAPGQ